MATGAPDTKMENFQAKIDGFKAAEQLEAKITEEAATLSREQLYCKAFTVIHRTASYIGKIFHKDTELHGKVQMILAAVPEPLPAEGSPAYKAMMSLMCPQLDHYIAIIKDHYLLFMYRNPKALECIKHVPPFDNFRLQERYERLNEKMRGNIWAALQRLNAILRQIAGYEQPRPCAIVQRIIDGGQSELTTEGMMEMIQGGLRGSNPEELQFLIEDLGGPNDMIANFVQTEEEIDGIERQVKSVVNTMFDGARKAVRARQAKRKGKKGKKAAKK